MNQEKEKVLPFFVENSKESSTFVNNDEEDSNFKNEIPVTLLYSGDDDNSDFKSKKLRRNSKKSSSHSSSDADLSSSRSPADLAEDSDSTPVITQTMPLPQQVKQSPAGVQLRRKKKGSTTATATIETFMKNKMRIEITKIPDSGLFLKEQEEQNLCPKHRINKNKRSKCIKQRKTTSTTELEDDQNEDDPKDTQTVSSEMLGVGSSSEGDFSSENEEKTNSVKEKKKKNFHKIFPGQ